MGTVYEEEAIDPEIVDAIPVRQSETTETGMVKHKPTTLLDYSALIMAARMNRRDPNHSIKQAMAICTQDKETAATCFYALPRGGKKISGPSIGLAETLAYTFGNMNLTVDEIKVNKEEGFVEVRGFVLDCETGLTASDTVRRPIKYGKNSRTPGALYDDDMINVTSNAARSILYRNLVLRVVPRPIWKKIYDKALAVASGADKPFDVRQKDCVAHWEKTYKVSKEKLLAHLERTAIADITVEDFEYLLGLEQAIKSGDTTAAKAFAAGARQQQETLDDLATAGSNGGREPGEEA